MMAGNPSWWSMLHPPPPSSSSSSSIFPSQLVLEYSSSLLPHELNSFPSDQRNLEPPQSWSQLLMGGLPREDQENYGSLNHLPHRLGNWEDHHHEQVLIPQLYPSVDHVVEESNSSIKLEINSHNNHDDGGHEDQFPYNNRPSWSEVQINIPPVSSPRSCVTSLSSNIMLDFSYNQKTQHADHPSECNSPPQSGICKKARVQPSSSQPPLKVRKEKLGDRITSLHQMVSPFGKTDTASVLLEAIGYIRFLHSQIEALSSPYLGNASKNFRNNPQSLLNDNCSLKRKGSSNQGRDYDEEHNKAKDLRSKGLCLVPVSCTQNVGGDVNIGADYWAPAYGSGF